MGGPLKTILPQQILDQVRIEGDTLWNIYRDLSRMPPSKFRLAHRPWKPAGVWRLKARPEPMDSNDLRDEWLSLSAFFASWNGRTSTRLALVAGISDWEIELLALELSLSNAGPAVVPPTMDGILMSSMPGLDMEKLPNNYLPIAAKKISKGSGAIVCGVPTPLAANMPLIAHPLDRAIEAAAGNRAIITIMVQPVEHSDIEKWLKIVEAQKAWVGFFQSVRTDATAGGAGMPMKLNIELEVPHAGLARRFQERLAERLRLAPGCGGYWAYVHVYAESEVVARQIGSAFSGCLSAGDEPEPQAVTCFPITDNFPPWEADCVPDVDFPPVPPPLLPSEAARYFGIPSRERPGLRVNRIATFGEDPQLPATVYPGASTQAKVNLGHVCRRVVPIPVGFKIPISDFERHALVVGQPGSGKTHTAMYVLKQLQGHGIPFLVLEPAKYEWGDSLRKNGIAVALPGQAGSNFRINPLEVPPGVPVNYYIDLVKSAFLGSYTWYPPMNYAFEQALYGIYTDKGINLSAIGKAGDKWPTILDLRGYVKTMKLEYDPNIQANIRGGIGLRLEMMSGGTKGRIFNTAASISGSELFDKPFVVELTGLGDDSDKAFLMSLLLIRLYLHREFSKQAPNALRPCHVTVIEEAHRVLGGMTQRSANPEVANPRAMATELFCNLLAEVRAFHEGIILIEQIPTKIAPDAIKNTHVRIVHRLSSMEDQRIVGESMAATEKQIESLSMLPTGYAAVYVEGLQQPLLVKVPK